MAAWSWPDDGEARSEKAARAHLQEIGNAPRSAGVIGESRTSVHSLPYCGIVEALASGRCDVTFMPRTLKADPAARRNAC
jgi:hypothetical protein